MNSPYLDLFIYGPVHISNKFILEKSFFANSGLILGVPVEASQSDTKIHKNVFELISFLATSLLTVVVVFLPFRTNVFKVVLDFTVISQ